MAKQLSKIGIVTGADILAGHVTQSIDAFTGIDDYDITVSGSVTVSGSLLLDGTTETSQSFILTYNTSSGQVYYTASSAIGGGGGGTTPTLQQVTDQGNTTTNDIIITGSLYQSGSFAYFQPNEFTIDALGDSVFSVGQLGTQDIKLGIPTTSTEVRGPLTASIISASGNIFSRLADNSNTNYKTVVVDPTTGKFYRTGSYAGGGGGGSGSGFPFSGSAVITGSLEVTGSITASSGVVNQLTASYAITASSIDPVTNFKPIITHTSNFNSEISYAGRYNIVGGTLAITVTTGSTPTDLTPGMEWDFFQTSSGTSFTFTEGAGVEIISRNNHKKLAAVGSAATLKYISGQTFHLVGDLTI